MPTVNISQNTYNEIQNHISNNGIINSDGTLVSWSTLLNGNTVNNRNKALFIYGLALHTASDSFAHSTYDSTGTRIWHKAYKVDDNGNIIVEGADDADDGLGRYECAEVFASEMIAHIKRFEEGNLDDYYWAMCYAVSYDYDKNFKMGRLLTYLEQIDADYPYKSDFVTMNKSVSKGYSD